MAETLQKQATRFTQTDRNGWLFTLTAKDMIDLLPIRAPEQLSFFTDTNRPGSMGAGDSLCKTIVDWSQPRGQRK